MMCNESLNYIVIEFWLHLKYQLNFITKFELIGLLFSSDIHYAFQKLKKKILGIVFNMLVVSFKRMSLKLNLLLIEGIFQCFNDQSDNLSTRL